MATFEERISSYLAHAGSKAKTIRGMVRAIKENNRSRKIIAEAMGRDLEGQVVVTPRTLCNIREAMVRRLRADSLFRKRMCRKWSKELVKITAERVGFGEFARAEEIDQYLIDAGLVPFSRIGILSPSMDSVRMAGGYLKTRGRESCVVGGCGVSFSYQYRTLRWENGLNWRVTDKYAGWKNTVRAVIVRKKDRTLVSLGWKTKSGKVVEKDIVLPASGVGKGYWGHGPALEGEIALPRQQDSYYHRYTLDGKFSGYAVYDEGNKLWEHADTISGLAAELDHKKRIREVKDKIKNLTSKDHRAIRLFARISTHRVGFDAARATGACKAGIQNWCSGRNLTIKDTVTVAELCKDSNVRAKEIARKIAAELWVTR